VKTKLSLGGGCNHSLSRNHPMAKAKSNRLIKFMLDFKLSCVAQFICNSGGVPHPRLINVMINTRPKFRSIIIKIKNEMTRK
jgi:hypothetical protein